MEIRKATMADLNTLLQMYKNARIFMAKHGNPNQWGDSRPSSETIKTDIKNGHQYICVEGGLIAATFFYLHERDETYDIIYEGCWLCDDPYGVVHRITSNGSVKGAASYCLQWAFDQCGNLRIDTHKDNYIMQNLLKKNGFSYCGVIICEDGTERLAYQKMHNKRED